jgi:hypothetical protein
MLKLSDSVLNLGYFDWLNFARRQLHTKIHYCVINYVYNDVMDNVYSPMKDMMLPTMQIIKCINKCIDFSPNAVWWAISGRVRYRVQLRTNNVQACVFNAVNDLSIKLIKDDQHSSL